MSCLPQLRKTDMSRKGHVRTERDLLKNASLAGLNGGLELIVRLFYGFQERDRLCLVSLIDFIYSWYRILSGS
jgi:hypothetical protein